MTTNTSGNRSSYVYAGLAGETAPGRVVKSGLYRMTNDEGGWELLTTDGGLTWKRVDMGAQPKTTIFGLAFDERNPKRMYCSTTGGEVFGSQDSGTTGSIYSLPEGATQVYALACS